MNYVISICDPKSLEQLTEICKELSLPLSIVLHGRGTAVRSMLDILGIDSNEKRVVLSVCNAEKTSLLLREQKKRMFLGVPGHGISAAIPIKSVGGGKTVEYFSEGQTDVRYKPETSYAYELIVAVANEGRTDLVMNAARAAGATGGTVLHGKGTGKKEEEMFFHVSIAREKEVVFIVAKSAQKAAIMQSILKHAGPNTEAEAIVFSLPVSEAAGFGMFEENI